MLKPSQILRSFDSCEYRRLIDRLLTNGRCHSRQASRLLHEDEVIMPAAAGMALQRICELAYWAVPEGCDLAHRLLRLQQRDGTFSCPSANLDWSAKIAATSVALRGLADWRMGFSHHPAELAMLDQAIERACTALASLITTNFEGMGDALRALVLWQLADCNQACASLPLRDMHNRLAKADSDFLRDDLSRLALTMAA